MFIHQVQYDRHQKPLLLAARDYEVSVAAVAAGQFHVPVLPPTKFTGRDRATGDFFGCAPRLGASGLRVMVGDLAGKGVGAGPYHDQMDRLLQRRANLSAPRFLAAAHAAWPGTRFASIAVLDVDRVEHHVRPTLAGHPSPALWAPGTGAVWLDAPRFGVVGVEDWFQTPYTIASRHLPLGGCCVLVTDGVLDAGVQHDRPFGEESLLQAIDDAAGRANAAEFILDRVFDHLGDAPLEDDLTVLVVRRTATAAARLAG